MEKSLVYPNCETTVAWTKSLIILVLLNISRSSDTAQACKIYKNIYYFQGEQDSFASIHAENIS